jgi:hypothetical protein
MTTLSSAQHCLDLSITVTQQFMGLVPGGSRIDLYYSGGRAGGGGQAPGGGPIRTQPGVFAPELSAALDKGHIQSGSDWASVTSRGVLELDGNVTLMLRASEKVECPVAGRLRGRAQLRDVRRPDGGPRFHPGEDVEAIFAVWRQGFEEGSWLPLVLSVSFEVPIFGFGDEQTETYERARELGSSLFLGLGKAIFSSARNGTIKTIALELHRLQHPSLQGGAAR